MIEPYKPEVYPLDRAFQTLHGQNSWDDYLQLYPDQATVFHTREWMQALFLAFGYEPKCLLAIGEDGGTLYAALPFMVDTRYGIQNYFSMPFDTYGGVIGNQEYAAGLTCFFLGLPGFGVKYCVEYHNNVPHANVETEILDLTTWSWVSMHKDNRTAVRSATRNGVSIIQTNDYYPIFDKVSDVFVKAILDTMAPKGLCKQFIAMLDGKPVGASLFFMYGKQAMYWANTVLAPGRRTNANHLLMWTALQQAQAAGCTSMNFGASPPGADGLLKFKRSWGTKTYHYTKTQHIPKVMRPLVGLRSFVGGV